MVGMPRRLPTRLMMMIIMMINVMKPPPPPLSTKAMIVALA